MKISIIIPAYNEEFLIQKCLESLFVAISKTDCEHEVIVVNNASTDRSREIASQFDVILVDEPRRGPVNSRMAGFAAASGDLIAYIDADSIVPDDWLQKIIREFSTDPELLALSGPAFYYDVSLTLQIISKLFYGLGLIIDRMNELVFNKGSLLQGGNFVMKRETFARIGGFDPAIDFYGDDTDLGRRVREIGKAKWTFDLPVQASSRRLKGQGVLNTGTLYCLNFIWINIFNRPFTQTHTDIRMPLKDFSFPGKFKYGRAAFSSGLALITAVILVAAGYISVDYQNTSSVKISAEHFAYTTYHAITDDDDEK